MLLYVGCDYDDQMIDQFFSWNILQLQSPQRERDISTLNEQIISFVPFHIYIGH